MCVLQLDTLKSAQHTRLQHSLLKNLPEIKQQFRNTLNNKNFESYLKLSRVQKQQTIMDLFLLTPPKS